MTSGVFLQESSRLSLQSTGIVINPGGQPGVEGGHCPACLTADRDNVAEHTEADHSSDQVAIAGHGDGVLVEIDK